MSKKRRGYLKHYNDATIGESFQAAIADQNYFSIVLFWYIIEKMNQEDSGKVCLDIKQTCRRLNVKKQRLLSACSVATEYWGQLSLVASQSVIEVKCANYAEYQESRGQKSTFNVTKEAHIKDKRLKIKDKRVFLNSNPKSSSKQNVDNSLNNAHATAKAEKFITEMIAGFTGPQQDWCGLGKENFYIAKDVLGVTRQVFQTNGFRPELMKKKWSEALRKHYAGSNNILNTE